MGDESATRHTKRTWRKINLPERGARRGLSALRHKTQCLVSLSLTHSLSLSRSLTHGHLRVSLDADAGELRRENENSLILTSALAMAKVNSKVTSEVNSILPASTPSRNPFRDFNRGVRAEQGGCYPWGSVFVIWLLVLTKNIRSSLSWTTAELAEPQGKLPSSFIFFGEPTVAHDT